MLVKPRLSYSRNADGPADGWHTKNNHQEHEHVQNFAGNTRCGFVVFRNRLSTQRINFQ